MPVWNDFGDASRRWKGHILDFWWFDAIMTSVSR